MSLPETKFALSSGISIAYQVVGEGPIDIHGGGIDLIFPHHENEIAQAEGATGKQFSRFWVHSEFLNLDHEKMSKSLGNVYTVRDIIDKGFRPSALRYRWGQLSELALLSGAVSAGDTLRSRCGYRRA